MKKASKEAFEKILGKMLSIDNTFLTKREVSTRGVIRREEYALSLPMSYSNKDVLYVPTGLKKNRTRTFSRLHIELCQQKGR